MARESGLHRGTIHDWIKNGSGTGSLTIASVYMVADALGDDRAVALKAAANLRDRPEPPPRDEEVEIILGSDFTELEKAQMVERLYKRREEERARRVADLRWMVGHRDEEAS